MGFRHDPRCEASFSYATIVPCCCLLTALRLCGLAALRRVLFLKKVTQCAALDEFGLFLVLADKVNAPDCSVGSTRP